MLKRFMLSAGLLVAAVSLLYPQAQAAQGAPVVAPAPRVSRTLQTQILQILDEFGLVSFGGAGAGLKPPSETLRGAILKVLADQNLIPANTPAVGAGASPALVQKVLAVLQQAGVLGGRSLTAGEIDSEDAVAGAILTADGSGGAYWAPGQAVSRSPAFDNQAPSTTKGDLIVHNGTVNARLPVGSDNQVLLADSTQALGVRWGNAGDSHPILDSTSLVKGSADGSKQFRFEVDGLAPGATRVATPPDADFAMARTDDAQTFTGVQTFTSSPSAPVGGANTQRFGANAAGAISSATDGTFLGANAGGSAGNAPSLTFIGANAGKNVTLGNYSTAVGANALTKSGGYVNTALGDQTLRDHLTGQDNLAAGAGALKQITAANNNTAVGTNAMEGVLSGNDNTAVGDDSLRTGASANRNVAVGRRAGHNATGSDNVLIGNNAADNTGFTGSSNIILGANADPSSATAANEFVAGSQSSPIHEVYFGKGARNSAPTAYTIRGTGGLGSAAGADLNLAGGKGATATQAGGRVRIQTAAAGSGDTPVDRLVVGSTGLTSLYQGASVASAATIVPSGNVFHVSGSTTVGAIASAGVLPGTTLTLIFDGAVTVTDNDGTLNLNGSFSADANDTLQVVFDGTNWYELSRSKN